MSLPIVRTDNASFWNVSTLDLTSGNGCVFDEKPELTFSNMSVCRIGEKTSTKTVSMWSLWTIAENTSTGGTNVQSKKCKRIVNWKKCKRIVNCDWILRSLNCYKPGSCFVWKLCFVLFNWRARRSYKRSKDKEVMSLRTWRECIISVYYISCFLLL